MATVMTNTEFVKKLKDIAQNYKTLYVMGCFGAPMTAANKKRYTQNHSYNRQASRTAMINAASADTFGFDCVCLIKGVLWGWSGNKKATYGGATYASNGVPDIGDSGMINVCKNISTDFSKIEVGEAVWMEGHIGVYIGDGLAVECTPKWANKVQITACNCTKAGYNRRNWTKHGKLPYIDYTSTASTPTTTPPSNATTNTTAEKPKTQASAPKTTTSTGKTSSTKTTSTKAVMVATRFSNIYNKIGYVIAKDGLHLRQGCGTSTKSLKVLKYGTPVRCYGYYTPDSTGHKWLYVVADGKTGFVYSQYVSI